MNNQIIVFISTVINYFTSNFINYDDNPHSVRCYENYFAVMNKQGEVLWTKESRYLGPKYSWMPHVSHLIYNVNNEGVSKVILTSLKEDDDAVYCFDYDGK